MGFKELQLLSYDCFKSGLQFLISGILPITMEVVSKTSLVSWSPEIIPLHPQPGSPCAGRLCAVEIGRQPARICREQARVFQIEEVSKQKGPLALKSAPSRP